MTRSQRNALAYIEEHWRKWGYSPTFRQVSEAIGLTMSGTRNVVLRLISRGWLTYTPKKRRSLVPITGALRGVGMVYDVEREKSLTGRVGDKCL